jgi:hypothetical protein
VTSGVIPRDGASFIAKGEDRVSAGFWRIPITGGAPQLILRLNDRWRTYPRPEFTTDGRRLFFMLTERESDIGPSGSRIDSEELRDGCRAPFRDVSMGPASASVAGLASPKHHKKAAAS